MTNRQPQAAAKISEISSQLGSAESPTLCHSPLEAPALAKESKLESKEDLVPPHAEQPVECVDLAEAVEVKHVPHEEAEVEPSPVLPEVLTPRQVADKEPTHTSAPSLKPSDFRALKLLGKGGQGTVLLVEHKQAGTIHALKIMEKYPESLKAIDKENQSPGEKGRNIGIEAHKAEKTHKRIFEEHAIMHFLALQPRNMTTCFLGLQASFHDSANFFFLTVRTITISIILVE